MAAAELEIIYWPALGRTLGPRLMLEDALIPYKRTNYIGQGDLPPTVVAVPCIKVDGEPISQTMAIMEVVADLAGFKPPSSNDDKSRQTMLNLHDIDEQGFNKRLENKDMTMEDCADYVNSRVKQFFTAIETAYNITPGTYFCGDRVTMVDFQLASCVLKLNCMFGAGNMFKMLRTCAPVCYCAFQGMMARPNLNKWVTGGFGGEPFGPPQFSHVLASNTPYKSGKMKIYMKAGCPFCSKLAGFMAETKLMDKYSFEPDDEIARLYVKQVCGKASFPALEYETGKIMLESDDIINKLAADHNINISELKAYNFIFAAADQNTMMKTFLKLFKMGVGNAGSMPELFAELEKM